MLGAAAAVVLVAALAAGAAPGYAEGTEQGLGGGMGQASATATAASGDGAAAAYNGTGTADPADAAAPLYGPVCGPVYGAYHDGTADDPSPAQAANMTARIDALYAEYDAILAEYGFVYREPANLTAAQMNRIAAEMDAALARHNGTLAEIDALMERSGTLLLGIPFEAFGPQATLAAVYQTIADENDDVLRRHGFAISTPRLSEADERRLSERLDEVMDKIERVYKDHCPAEAPAPSGADGGLAGHGLGGHYGAAPHGGAAPAVDALYAEHDAILAEYGFVYREPANLTAAQLEQIDARTWRLAERHADAVEGLAERLAPMLANGSITVADAFARDQRLADRANAEHIAILAEFGYTVVVPELSAKDREALNKRLADIYGRIDAALAEAYAVHGAEAGGRGEGPRAATAGQSTPAEGGNATRSDIGSATASERPELPPAQPPSGGDGAVLDAFDEDGRFAEQAGDEHGAPAAGYGYRTATPEPSEGNGTAVDEELADIYGRIDAAYAEDYPGAYTTAATDGGDAAYAEDYPGAYTTAVDGSGDGDDAAATDDRTS